MRTAVAVLSKYYTQQNNNLTSNRRFGMVLALASLARESAVFRLKTLNKLNRPIFLRRAPEERMKALRFHAAKDLRLENIDKPASSPPKGQVLIRNTFVGICGTDLDEYVSGPIFIPVEPHPFTGATGPQVFGHEFGGIVEAVGEGVTSVRQGGCSSALSLRHQ
jgi:hypothetical protein